MEHYVDGDLLDDTEPTHRNPASPDSLHVWGELDSSLGLRLGVCV